MATYALDIRDRTGGALIKAGVAFQSLSARWARNGRESIEVDVDLYADLGSALAGQAELQLKRDSTIVWAGPWLGSDTSPKRKKLRINGEGLWWWFRQRIVTSDLGPYNDVNQHQIAWNLLSHAQGQTHGSLGIVQGTHTGTAKTRTRYYCAANGPNVAEEVEALTAYETGFDFAINPATRAFDTWSPSRMSASGLSLSGLSVDELTWIEDIRGVRNYITAIGENKCGSILVTASDASLASTYGRLQEPIDAEDEDDSEGEVTEVANEALRARKRARFDARVVFRESGTGAPAFSSLIPGNTLLLSDDRGYSTFTNKVLRIEEVTLNLDNGLPNQPVFSLELSAAVAA